MQFIVLCHNFNLLCIELCYYNAHNIPPFSDLHYNTHNYKSFMVIILITTNNTVINVNVNIDTVMTRDNN